MNSENLHYTLIMAKIRIKQGIFDSIPRSELVAAVLAAKTPALVLKELEMKKLAEYFRTDNKVFLGYVANDSRTLKTIVAYRVQTIQEYSSANQWMYIQFSR